LAFSFGVLDDFACELEDVSSGSEVNEGGEEE
jgi:hypothetical protein